MKKIQLVTFDVFGTLVDWRGRVEQTFPGRFQEFLKHSEERQRCELPVLPYENLLKDVAQKMGLDLAGARKFASSFGQATPFGDYLALQELRSLVRIGCISNSDALHQIDVMRSLAVAWDLCAESSVLQGYKPEAKPWRRAADWVQTRFGVRTFEWLHVSAYVDYDLKPAKELGILTCYIPRPGTSDAVRAQELPVDFVVSDLYQLAEILRVEKDGPWKYSVQAQCADQETASAFLNWMRVEHASDLLKVTGCQECRVFQAEDFDKKTDSANSVFIQCEYIFTSRLALDHYLSAHAPALRLRGRELFSEEKVKFTRTKGAFVLNRTQRKPRDFSVF